MMSNIGLMEYFSFFIFQSEKKYEMSCETIAPITNIRLVKLKDNLTEGKRTIPSD